MPHKRTTAELQEHGQILYRRKEYTKALELFNEAIASEPNLTVTLLDNRAATHDKLDDITSALKDAKTCIRLYEQDPTGYLRAGKLLQKAGRHTVALGIYKHGIKKKTKNVDLLVKLHDKLLRSTAPPTAADPFAQMPIELVEMILSYLSFNQIVACTSVSKQWNSFISSLPNLWTTLDLSQARKSVKNSFISLCLNRSQRQITTANLKMLAGPEKAITALTHHCKALHTLSISDGGLRSSDFINQISTARSLKRLKLGTSAQMGIDAVALLLRELSNLSHLEVLAVIVADTSAPWSFELPKLESINLMASRPRSNFMKLNIASLVQRTPNLESLTLSGFHTGSVASLNSINLELCSKLKCLDFSRCDITASVLPIPGFPPSLRVLRANKSSSHYNDLQVNPQGHRIQPANYFLPRLEELSIGSPQIANIVLSNAAMLPLLPAETVNTWTQDQKILAVLRKTSEELSKLKTLSIEVVAGINHLPVLLSSFRLSVLENLTLRDSTSIDDTIAELIALNLPELKTLDLGSTAITGYGVKKIVESCEKLQQLRLNGCQRCSIDAVEWARSKGLKVDFAMDTDTKGKKVRYGN